MKKFAGCLMMTLLLAATAYAEPVGRTQDGYIHRYTAQNGQELYYVSQVEDPLVLMEDVNFDGVEDIVVPTVQGTTNAYYEFFVWDGARYVLASLPTDEAGLPNYVLYPEKGLILATSNNGSAGLLHETTLYCWEGATLLEVRRAVSEHPEGFSSEGEIITQTTDMSKLKMTVTEPGEEGEAVVLWEETMDMQDAPENESAWLQEEEEVLWNGL